MFREGTLSISSMKRWDIWVRDGSSYAPTAELDDYRRYEIFGGVSSNGEIEKMMQIVKKDNIEVVVAVGGGSAVDTAKATAYYTGKHIVIGDGTFIGHNTVLATLDHDIDPDRRHILYPAPIHIGSKVWIGAGVIVTKGVTIGDNSIIAAGAVVTHDVPSNVIAAGVPAKVLRDI